MTQVSVVIPSYNAEALLPRTLDALKAQNFKQDIEVLVVDCSESTAVEKLCNEYDVGYHHETDRFNPGIGRNIGAKLAKGELLVFLDADVELESDAIANAWEYYALGHKAFGGALELNEQVDPSIASYLEHYFFNHESQAGRPACSRSNLSSALMVLKKDLFLDAGGFKDIPRMQDTEMTERLIRNGVELYFCPSVIGLQIQDSPLKKVLKKIYINGKNLYFIRYQKKSFIFKTCLMITLPILSTFKICRIIGRHLRYQTLRQKFITLGMSPLLFVSGAYWMAGLYRSMIFGGEISKKRD